MNGRRLKHDIITTQEQLAEYVTLTDAEKEGICNAGR